MRSAPNDVRPSTRWSQAQVGLIVGALTVIMISLGPAAATQPSDRAMPTSPWAASVTPAKPAPADRPAQPQSAAPKSSQSKSAPASPPPSVARPRQSADRNQPPAPQRAGEPSAADGKHQPIAVPLPSQQANPPTSRKVTTGSAATIGAKTSMGNASYEPIAFDALPQWSNDDHLAALKAFQASCPPLMARERTATGKPTDAGVLAICRTAMDLPAKVSRAEARAFFQRHFQPHRVRHAASEGLMTGYFEPMLEGSRRREGRFQTAILKRPPDLVTLVSETGKQVTKPDTPALASLTHARRAAAGLVPFATRAEIAAGALADKNLELIYLADEVDKFFLQIQGSGRIRLTDGTTIRVHYDGKNGHPYTSIGRYLIAKGLLAADKVSMGALGRWLKSDAARARHVLNQNASYVFFREMPADAGGPLGAIQVSLVAGRSLAIDPAFHRLGSPVYVSAPTLKPKGHAHPFNRLMVAHDVGSAIKGPERGDIYFGSGETAGRIAGVTKHPGNLFVFLPANAASPSAQPGGPPPPGPKGR